MSKMTLYDVAQEGMVISDILSENDGELTPELEQRIDQLLLLGADKIESAAMVLKQIEADSNACKTEATRLSERSKGFKAQADRLRERIRIAVDAAFDGKVKTPRFTIYTQQNPNTVAFDLAEEFTLEMLSEDHPEFISTELSLNKAALKAAYERDPSTLPESIFVDARDGKRSLRIR